MIRDHPGPDLQTLGDRPRQDVQQEPLRPLPLRLQRTTRPLPLFHEIPEHHIRAQGQPHNVQHKERDHQARRERRRVLGEARVEQPEHHQLVGGHDHRPLGEADEVREQHPTVS